MVMFIKHSYTISEAKQKQIEHRFLLVFSNSEEIGEINEERIKQYYEQVEKDKEDKKYRIYRQMADEQIKNLISMMSGVEEDSDDGEGDDYIHKKIHQSKATFHQSAVSNFTEIQSQDEEARQILEDSDDEDKGSTYRANKRYNELVANYSGLNEK